MSDLRWEDEEKSEYGVEKLRKEFRERLYGKSCRDEQPCLIDAFFRHEAEKPAHKRVNYCHISCPCSKCNPRFM